jgi:Family of unknown function (DUF5309)
MSTITGTGTTYNLPNYHGELFTVAITETPFLSAIGGINGSKTVNSKTFEWQTIGRRTSSANNSSLEGQNAPTATAQARSNVYNTTEIHHSQISVSYSHLATVNGQFSGANIAPEFDDAMIDEIQLQTMAELNSMAIDINQSFLSGTLAIPSDNSTARATQGILGAIQSNVSSNGSNRALTATIVNELLKEMRLNGAPLAQGTTDAQGNQSVRTVFLCGSDQLLNLTNVYSSNAYLSAPVRDSFVAGMAIKTVITPFGTFGVLEDPWMPAREIAVVDLAVCWPVFTEIPAKGVLFVEPLARTGAFENFQLYGEVGLEYGPEKYHGLITNLLNSDGS